MYYMYYIDYVHMNLKPHSAAMALSGPHLPRGKCVPEVCLALSKLSQVLKSDVV